MLVKHAIEKVIVLQMVDEVEGIMILVGVTPDQEYLNALEKLPVKEIKLIRDSYAQEYEALTGKHILTL